MSREQAAVMAIRQRLSDFKPRLALMLGSGLGAIAEHVVSPTVIPYEDIPGFPIPTVQGHQGRLLIGVLYGVWVVCLEGRAHCYEGCPTERIVLPIRALRALGCDTLILTNAAGSLRADMGPGELMIIGDHINWAGCNPLIGPNDDTLGPRFPDMTRAYDPELRAWLRQAARAQGIELFEGVYLMYPGPSFETPAEIRAFAALGADATGMSTVPECLVANHCGMRVAGISVITNLAAGLEGQTLGHEQTLAVAQAAAERLGRLLSDFLPRIMSRP